MKVKCSYCGSFIQDTDEKCPFCNATNEEYVRESTDAPKTIEELKEWYVSHNLPPEETTRFFIGINYEKPKAFGIYQDGRNFIVYKNKADGSRAIRYKGSDEAYAVNELYQKLKGEIANQKSHQAQKNGSEKISDMPISFKVGIVAWCILMIGSVTAMIIGHAKAPASTLKKTNGYYSYDNVTYYSYYDDWYQYDNYGEWIETEYVPAELDDNYEDYFESTEYNDEFNVSSFAESDAYLRAVEENENNSDSRWDSSDSWNSSDTWDLNITDWGGDW